jgi:hypothetical protein
MKITNQNLEEILVLVICAIIPEVICIPLIASVTRLSHFRITPASETNFHPPRNWRSLLETKVTKPKKSRTIRSHSLPSHTLRPLSFALSLVEGFDLGDEAGHG